jgi:hypothetical protein
VVYRCKFNAERDCSPLIVENTKQTPEENSGQWLGGSMDGHGGDNDPLVVCAPKRMIEKRIREKGVCYLSRESELLQKSSIIEYATSE